MLLRSNAHRMKVFCVFLGYRFVIMLNVDA